MTEYDMEGGCGLLFQRSYELVAALRAAEVFFPALKVSGNSRGEWYVTTAYRVQGHILLASCPTFGSGRMGAVVFFHMRNLVEGPLNQPVGDVYEY